MPLPQALPPLHRRGNILLAGGNEFGGKMKAADLRGIALAGGFDAPVCIIPTAAAADNNHERAGSNGKSWFQQLGARNTRVIPILDRSSADDGAISTELRNARLIYMLGGFPGYLAQSLHRTRAWKAVRTAYRRGALIAGSSAGAMVLCSHFFDPHKGQLFPGLGLLHRSCVLPHHNRFGSHWAERLRGHLPHHTLIGIDEETALLTEAEEGRWRVWGAGGVTLYRRGRVESYRTDAIVHLI